jgi:spore coat protein U-like protein
MKKYAVVLWVLAFVLAVTGGAYAGTATPSVPVTGVVGNTCVVGGTGALAFGTLDADTNSGGATTNLTGMTLWCTKNKSVSFSVDNGQNYTTTRNMKSGTDLLPYTVSFTSPVNGEGRGDTTTMITNLNLRAIIAAGALDNVPAGSYSDTVVMTISY